MDSKRKTAVATALLASSVALVAALAGADDRFRLSAVDDRLDGAPASNGEPAGEGGIASQPCGDGLLTQSTSNAITPGHTIQCINEFGIPTANGLARTFNITAPQTVCGVQFGVQSNNAVGPWPVTVNLYEGDINGPFVNLQLRGSRTISIPVNTSGQLFTAVFIEPVEFAAGEKMVVELHFPSRVVSQGGDGGRLFLGSNNQGQSSASYIRAESCDLSNFTPYASLNLPNIHLVMNVFTGAAGGPQTGACCIGGGAPPCPADLSGNGNVGVPDLLALLGQWGPCPPPPTQCPADLSGSGNVGVPDLLSLLGQWGPCPGGGSTTCALLDAADCTAAEGVFHGAGSTCPSPTACPDAAGVCCLGGGACQAISPSQCAQAGGQFMADAVSCADVICDQGPACPTGAMQENETCGEQTNDGCNMPGAPVYVPISCGQSVCGSAWAENNLRDTDWYTITVTEQTRLTWSVDSAFQAQVSILNNQCGSNLVELAGGETEPGSSVTTATACLHPGTYRLFVAIDDFEGHSCGGGFNNYVASLSCAPCEVPEPQGATCNDAIELSVGQTAAGSNVGNDWEVDLYCSDFVEPESGVVWFEIVGDGTELTAFNANVPGTVFDTQMYVYCGTCETQGCTGQQVQHPNFGAAYRWCSEPGHTYYLAVWGTFGAEGDISMGLSSGAACTAEPCQASGQCAGICGGQAPSGCFCDDTCHIFGDCCPGICNDCPEAGGCVSECFGLCGFQAPSGCWCDATCGDFNDCCENRCEVCPDLPTCIGGSCAGLCGTGYPTGCYDDLSCECFCDLDCFDFSDCCADICLECPQNPLCP